MRVTSQGLIYLDNDLETDSEPIDLQELAKEAPYADRFNSAVSLLTSLWFLTLPYEHDNLCYTIDLLCLYIMDKQIKDMEKWLAEFLVQDDIKLGFSGEIN